MAEIIRMPRMSDTMEEGVIASWLKKVGDEVKSGDILAEVETDKATMELEAYEEGTLLYHGVKEKESVKVDGVIAIIGEKGENIDGLLKEMNSEASSGSQEAKEDTSASVDHEEKAEEIDTSNIHASVITMPRMSDTMTEGTIASWLKKVGDEVKSGDILAEVETDKATMELEAYEDGQLLYIGVEEGKSVPVDGVLAVIGEKGADYDTLLKAQKTKATIDEKPPEEKRESTSSEKDSKTAEAVDDKKPVSQSASSKTSVSTATSTNGRVKASPLAKKLAEEMGYDISKIPGTGEGGRIIKRDIESYEPAVQPTTTGEGIVIPTVVGEESFEEESISQMRKTIARRLSESKFTAPHFYVTMEINMDKAIEARKSMNDIAPVKISFNDMVVKAVAASLRQHPEVNVSWLGDKIRKNHHIHIGVAVAIEDGLVVPVVRFADSKTLSQISAEVKDLGQKAKSKQLQPKDWEGNTFTISNLGMFGVEEFTAIINPPDACILAVGGIKQTPIVKDGQIVPGNTMKVTLSCDHRAVDGAMGAAFLQTLKNMLEDPVRILV